jgi:hypothetical protein
MKLALCGLLVLASLSAMANDATDKAKVKAITAKYLGGEDTKVTVTKITDGLCGAEGPTFVSVVSVKKFERTLLPNDSVGLKTVWVKTRTYGITAAELKAGSKVLMASEQCLE